MKAALYLRVSTGDQATANQEPELLELAGARRWNVVGVYREQATVGDPRPEFDRLMEDARCGRFRVLGVWALDRIGRDMLATVRSVLELERLGVQIVSMREPWLDTGGPVKNLLLAIFAWVAEQERARIGERTRAALAAARARGVRLGGPPLDAAKVAAALDACQRGMSFRAAAKRYGISDRALRKRARGFIR